MVTEIKYSEKEIFDLLKEIEDPEIPVINIVELGVVRKVSIHGDEVVVEITPTYSGCPAMKMIEDEISGKLKEKGINKIKIKTIYSPAWTTDWLSHETKDKLKSYGIAPPEKVMPQDVFPFLKKTTTNVHCPYCNSANTAITSNFGSTPCKALHFCNNCLQPFEEFKCI